MCRVRGNDVNLSRGRQFAASILAGFVLSVAVARWSLLGKLAMTSCILLVIAITIRTAARKQLPVFSLRMLLCLLGLAGCGASLWNLGGPWQEVQRFGGDATSVAISPDSRLVAASQGLAVEIRETRSGNVLHTLKKPRDETGWFNFPRNLPSIFSIEFSEDGEKLLTVGWRSDPHLYSSRTGESIRSWPNTPWQRVARGRVSRSRVVASLSKPHRGIGVYELDSREPVLALDRKVGENRGSNCCLSRDGNFLAIRRSKKIRLWDVDAGTRIGEIPADRSYFVFQPSTFSPDATRVAVPNTDGVAMYSLDDCEKVAEWKRDDVKRIYSLEWSPDSSQICVSYSARKTPKGKSSLRGYLIDRDGRELAPIEGVDHTFSPLGDRIAAVQFGGNVVILDARTGNHLIDIPTRGRVSFGFGRPCQFSADGNWLIHDGDAVVYRRNRAEWWYGMLQVPAHWGFYIFLSFLIHAAIARLLRKIPTPESESPDRSVPDLP